MPLAASSGMPAHGAPAAACGAHLQACVRATACRRRFRAVRIAHTCVGREFVPAADLLLCADKEVGKKAAPASSPRLWRGALCYSERRLGCGTRSFVHAHACPKDTRTVLAISLARDRRLSSVARRG